MSYAVQRTGDEVVNRNLDAIKQELDALRAALAVLGGQVLEDVSLTTSDTEVFHALAKPNVRYIPIKLSTNAVVYDGATASTRPRQSITLRASAAVTATLVLF